MVGMLVVIRRATQRAMGMGRREDTQALEVLFTVQGHSEKVLNKTGMEEEPQNGALYGRRNRVRQIEDGNVTREEGCHHQTREQLFCTYYKGDPYGCFTKRLPGDVGCAFSPWRGGPFETLFRLDGLPACGT
ncbi:hypothetical protein, unlikely [Trypanosoma congolense IL3000]|uniref:Uncharacterized protein n=1 Tax=Trypanosoma congolense (strain IL3000) TaxID=1068625 RepID=F9W442_TRYCI|nr:hypothetical protein, unlikely [Trypanosoma congolense IL3000]